MASLRSQQEKQQQQQQQQRSRSISPDTSTSSSNQDLQHDAVLASTALMGENVLDSPTGPKMTTNPVAQTRRTMPINYAAGLRPPSLDRSADAYSVGLMAQSLAWARRQRDRRQRQYLQHQAEQQLRKIKQATDDPQDGSSSHYLSSSSGRSIYENPTFRTLLNLAGSRNKAWTGESQQTLPDDINNTDEEYDIVSARVSKSGIGYSVQVAIDDADQKIHLKQQHEEDASFIPPVRVEPESDDVLKDCPFVLQSCQMQQIACDVLPTGIAYCRWKRLYSLARDGDSFDNCLRLLQNEKNTLLVIRTSKNEVFGGFADEVWECSNHKGGYYGGASACLFKIIISEDDNNNNNDNTVVAYHWSGANRYVQLCDGTNKLLALGGGGDDGHFGLCLEQDFQMGSTGPCETFDNEPLCSQENFAIVDMEIYGFLLGQF